jgi:AcrR family transcriptional regulator
MPQKTFTKLPQERQEAIIEVAIAEFTGRDYESASLSRIIDRSGVTRGGFYRYFAGKREVYDFLIERCLAEKDAFIQDRLDLGRGDFFEVLRKGMDCHVAFALERPRPSAFLLSAHRNGDLELERFLFLSSGERTMAEGIKAAQAAGQLRADIDPDFALFAISALILGLGPYMARACGIGPDAPMAAGGRELLAIQACFDQAVELLRGGLRAPRA